MIKELPIILQLDTIGICLNVAIILAGAASIILFLAHLSVAARPDAQVAKVIKRAFRFVFVTFCLAFILRVFLPSTDDALMFAVSSLTEADKDKIDPGIQALYDSAVGRRSFTYWTAATNQNNKEKP